MLIVQKFGGSSLAGLERLRSSAKICAETYRRNCGVVAVVSAMGKSTDELLDIADRINRAPPKRELDALLATGEQKSAALLAIMLQSLGIRARSFTGAQAGIYTDMLHGEAQIERLLPESVTAALNEGILPVVAGFQGINARGDVCTLGRGGSDTTAAALASALKADRCEIYTDVSGIYTADPRLIPEARLVKEIDYGDMLTLARSGSQVLHSRSVELAMREGVKLHLLSSFVAAEGSTVTALPDERRSGYAGVTRDVAQNTVTLAGRAADAEALEELKTLLSENNIFVKAQWLGEGFVRIQTEEKSLLQALRIAHSMV